MKFVAKPLVATADISRGKSTRLGLLKSAVAVVVVLGALYLLALGGAALLASRISDRTEANWFAWKRRPVGDQETPAFHRARKVFARLVRQPGLRKLPFELFVLQLEGPNAAALPGGWVGVTPGLLEQVKSEPGMALVLAHELGHHQYRHCLKRLGFRLLLQGVVALLSFNAEGSMISPGYTFLELGYSRDQERQADRFALDLVKQVFGTTQGSLEFFEMIRRDHDSGGSRWAAWLTTHPLIDERLRELRAQQKSLESPRSPK